MDFKARPLSPIHIYSPQLTSILSITHRGTGIILGGAALALAYWLLVIAYSPETYTVIQIHTGRWYGQCLLLVFVFSFYYHLCNGVRHLFWDMTLGLEIKTTYLSGYLVCVVSIALTFLSYLLI